jgi:hypothetical protein
VVSDASTPIRRLRWSTAAIVVGGGSVLMIVVGAGIVPYGRFLIRAIYEIVGNIALPPFGLAIPGGVGFVLTNGAILAVALAAGRRIGGVMAHQAVNGRLGSFRLIVASAWIAGAAGAVAFVATVPLTTGSDPGAPWPYQVGYLLVGSLLHVGVLAAGPPRGVYRYLNAHPYCRSCFLWLQRETGGGFFAEHDAGHLLAALAADAYDELRDLPVEERWGPGRSYSLQWWACPSCHREAYLTCLPEDGAGTGPAVLSRRVMGQSVDQLRSLMTHRQVLHDRRPVPNHGPRE